MSGSFGKHALVIGAGIAGLAAAKVLSAHFDTVTVLERDKLPDAPDARVGTPQARQVHVLLAGGLKALEEYLPGIEDALVAAGAHRATVGSEIRVELPGMEPLPARPFGFHSMCMSRPLFEFVMRQEVIRQKNIEIRAQCRVSELVTSEDGKRVIGAQYQSKSGPGGLIEADFVVDAATRTDLTMQLLKRLGMPAPRETAIGINLTYATAIFDLPNYKPDGWKAVIHRPSPSTGRGGFLFPIEDGKWHVNLNGVHGDGPTGDFDNYIEYAKSLRTSTVYDALRTGTMVGTVQRFVLEASSRRWFDELAAFPEGLVVIGDAICRFNPAYGQGMSVAVQEAAALNTLLAGRRDSQQPLDGLAPDYFKAIRDVLETPWGVAENDLVYPQTTGERTPEVAERMQANRNLQKLAFDHHDMHLLWGEVTNLLKPGSVLRSPDIAARLAMVEEAA